MDVRVGCTPGGWYGCIVNGLLATPRPLPHRQYHEVLRIVKKTTIYGQSLVAYLQQKQCPEA